MSGIAIFIIFLILVLMNPKRRNLIKFFCKYIFFFMYLSTISIIFIPLSIKNPTSCKAMSIIATMCDPVAVFLGINWKIKNGQKTIGPNKSAIFVSNHQSMYDIPAMLHLWHVQSIQCSTIARNFFFWLWPVGLAMWLGGTIFINRQTGSEQTKMRFNEAARKLFKNKDKLWVYVEGTRNKNPEKLLPFKKGAFVTAIEHQVPLQPVVISPFYFIDFKNKRFDSGTVIIEVLEPISTEGMTMQDLDMLIEKTYNIMSQKYAELRNEVKSFKTGIES